jgi:hypothetical protein
VPDLLFSEPRFRFSPTRAFGPPITSVRVRPFSSRAFGSAPLYSSLHEQGESEDDELEEEDDNDDGETWNEKKPVDIAGFTFGIPGTESEGTFVVGTLGGRGKTGGRLLEFSTRRMQEEMPDHEDVKWTKWTGKKYAQGGFV